MSTAMDFAPYKVVENYGNDIENLSPRLIELRSKIRDENYLDSAINRIAFILSRKLIDNPDELQLNSENC